MYDFYDGIYLRLQESHSGSFKKNELQKPLPLKRQFQIQSQEDWLPSALNGQRVKLQAVL